MLKNLFKKTDLKNNLLIATSGTAIAQVIHLATTPILTRVYDPEAFGQFAIFMSIIGILTSFATFKYDLAILIAKDEEVEALDKLIRKFSIGVGIITFLVGLILYAFDNFNYSIIFGLSSFGAFISGRFWTTRAISNKLGLFKDLSIAKVLENGFNAGLAILVGLLKPMGWVLMSSKIIGLLASYSFMRHRNKKKLNQKQVDKLATTKEVAKKYHRFPKYTLPADITANLNLSLIVFIFTSLFGEESAGHIGLSTRILSIPINFISISFLDVFRHRAIEDFKTSGSFDTIFKKFFFMLSSLTVPLILVIFFFGPELFQFVFGEEWLLAGTYSKFLVILYAMRLVSSPLSYSFSIQENQQINLYFQIAFVCVGLTSILTSYYYFKSDIICIMVYSVSMFVVNGLYLFTAYRNSKLKIKN